MKIHIFMIGAQSATIDLDKKLPHIKKSGANPHILELHSGLTFKLKIPF